MVEHFTMYFRPTLNQSLSLYMYIRGDYLMRIIMIYELIPWSMHACHSEQNNIKLVHYWLISLNLLTLSYKCTLCYIAASKYRSYDFIIWMVRLKMNRLMQKSCDWFNNYYLNIVLNRTVQCVVANLSSLYIESINLLPGNLKDKCLYLMSKRGCITDANLPKVRNDLKTWNFT